MEMNRSFTVGFALCVWITLQPLVYAAIPGLGYRVVGTVVRVYPRGFDLTVDRKQSDPPFDSRGAALLSIHIDEATSIIKQNPRDPAPIRVGGRVEIKGTHREMKGNELERAVDLSPLSVRGLDATSTSRIPNPTPDPKPAAAATTSPSSNLNFCNQFPETVYAAFAFQENGGWTSTGWLEVPPNTCKESSVKATYFRVETRSQLLGNGKYGPYGQQHVWGEDRQFCVGYRSFIFHHADSPCAGAHMEGFDGGSFFPNIVILPKGSLVREVKPTYGEYRGSRR
jgi:uncharacterized membrane protein